MHSTWFSSTFLRFLKFPQIKEWEPYFIGWTNSAERLNYLVPPSVFQLKKNLMNQSSSFFSRFYCILLHVSAVFLSDFKNFLQLKRVDLISLGGPFLQNGWIIWSPLLYFNFKSWKDSKSLSFVRFQFVRHDTAVFFTFFWNLQRLQNVDLISWGGNELCKMTEWRICISLAKTSRTEIVSHTQCLSYDLSLLVSVFQNFEKLKREEQFCEAVKFSGPTLFYLSFRNFSSANFTSFI